MRPSEPKFIKKLPKGSRTPEQIRNHYLVEKGLADQLKKATKEERKELYKTLYKNLFEKVPDHPRLQRRENQAAVQSNYIHKIWLIKEFLAPNVVFLEFGAGDCQFSYQVSPDVAFVYAVDISDQRSSDSSAPENFKLVLYNGYSLSLDNSTIDIAFSDQLLEHLHPEDTKLHFTMIKNLLKPNGIYVFRTPYKYSGPHDVSQYFSNTAEGFHLHEWTFQDVQETLQSLNFKEWYGYLRKKKITIKIPAYILITAEKILRYLPWRIRRVVARILMRDIQIVAKV